MCQMLLQNATAILLQNATVITKCDVYYKFPQYNDYFVSLLSEFQCGFRQDFNAQQRVLVWIEKLRKIKYRRGAFAAGLTVLKDFDCIPHGLLIAKLGAFGFNKKVTYFYQLVLRTENKKPTLG